MWHSIRDVAAHRRLPEDDFLSFAIRQAPKFGVIDTSDDPKVSTFDVRDLVNAFQHLQLEDAHQH